jgi:hypothetical protein
MRGDQGDDAGVFSLIALRAMNTHPRRSPPARSVVNQSRRERGEAGWVCIPRRGMQGGNHPGAFIDVYKVPG